ncbi:D-Ala-D-Ala carboxypeptidase family metallohydrolase [Pseudomonas auratipiscis]|uniref:D-Ala-D-Ala carboxypeptidase family metallohydrolase n=1 Tax=Pseudomonas auratipiscis TaxID=3115853 RepID=A0AB35WXG7_9PSED|nr:MULTISPECIES: D-Ala-D-Ala carboxypeptidase family metallohydrolase [unclassified Pseudomonas]MEE1868950.1 D-Ala-D-Ala carboxypeptidase family metallohydrolase [Pseudomonas sp. 120P]MEE1959597.1 D-Ala-D-Ala carboxypeptidase family metallohydrolase [Pseudomonas sp. 119P]
MNLSEHFTLAEMTASQSAVRLGIDNSPSVETLDNLRRLCALLEQVRLLVEKPVLVSSGYRSTELNRIIGGAPQSAHMQGLAADINVPGMSPATLARCVADSPLMFDQLIIEFDQWVHLGLAEGLQRRQLLTIRKGAGYLPGLV